MRIPGRNLHAAVKGGPKRQEPSWKRDRKERWRGHTPTITDAQPGDNNKVEQQPRNYVNLVACPALACLSHRADLWPGTPIVRLETESGQSDPPMLTQRTGLWILSAGH